MYLKSTMISWSLYKIQICVEFGWINMQLGIVDHCLCENGPLQ